MRKTAGFSLVKSVFVVAVIAGGGYAGYHYWKKPSNAPIEYRTTTVAKGDIVQSVIANGSLVPVRMVEVGSQISGTITEITVDFNSKVKAGDLVARIDPATYERALGQSEAELANAEAARELTRLNFDRAKELLNGNLISKSEYDQARVNLMQAEASVKTRESNVERAKVDLSRTTIFAPMDGIVISRKIEAGQTVAASMNTPTLFVIANDLTKMQIEAAVSEADVGGVEEGQKVNFTVEAFQGRTFAGTVRQMRFAPVTNQNVVSYTSVVEVDNRDMKLRPGMTATASIIVSERKGVLKLPSAALRFRPPTNAVVRADANAPAKGANAPAEAPKVEVATTGPFAGLPVPPWQGGGQLRRPSEEERTAYLASLTPDQKTQYEKIVADMRARFAQSGGGGEGGGRGGGGGSGGGERRRTAATEGPRSQTIYLLKKETQADGNELTVLQAATVKVGASDATSVEVIEGLKEGDVVVSGTVSAIATASAPAGPFGGNPFGGGPRGR